jgi:hypothetical protein
MSTIINVIEDNIYDVMAQFQELPARITQLQEVYSQVNLAAYSDNDPVSVTGKLTKDNLSKGSYIIGQVKNFLGNSAAAVFNHNRYLLQLQIGGDTAPAAQISSAIEYFASGVQGIASSLLFAHIKAALVMKLYFANSVNGIVSALSSSPAVIPGGTLTAAKLSAGITFCEQYGKLITEQATATADYQTTVAQWKR